MRIPTSINTKGQIYIKKDVRNAMGFNPGAGKGKIAIIANSQTFIIVPFDLPDQEILESLKTITMHLKHNIKRAKI